MAEYGVVLAVITLGVVRALGILSGAIGNAIERVVSTSSKSQVGTWPGGLSSAKEPVRHDNFIPTERRSDHMSKQQTYESKRGQTMAEFALVLPILCCSCLLGSSSSGSLQQLHDPHGRGPRRRAQGGREPPRSRSRRAATVDCRRAARQTNLDQSKLNVSVNSTWDQGADVTVTGVLPVRDQHDRRRRAGREPPARQRSVWNEPQGPATASRADPHGRLSRRPASDGGAVLDVGSWYARRPQAAGRRRRRRARGAQELPDDTGYGHGARAVEYGDKNGGDVTPSNVSFETRVMPNDTVVVRATERARLLHRAVRASTRSTSTRRRRPAPASLGQARYVAPIAVDIKHPSCCSASPTRASTSTTRCSTSRRRGPGAFRFINLDRSHGGTGPSRLGDWIRDGFAGLMPLDNYYSDPGAKFNASQVSTALNERIGDAALPDLRRHGESGRELRVPRSSAGSASRTGLRTSTATREGATAISPG